jgi:hypothetical protein
MTRGDWSRPAGIWSACAKQRVLNCYEWVERDGKIVPLELIDTHIQVLFEAVITTDDPIAFEALELLSELAAARGDEATGYLSTWRATRERGFPERPRKRGQPPWANAERDRLICDEIKHKMREGEGVNPPYSPHVVFDVAGRA